MMALEDDPKWVVFNWRFGGEFDRVVSEETRHRVFVAY